MRTFSFKTFTSLLLVLTFLSLVLSGVMLYLSPSGRIAHWTHWTLLGLGKEQWGGIHILMAIVFLTGSLFHLLKFNWKIFLHYLRTKKTGFQFSKELLASLCLFSAVLIGTLTELPPFISVMAVHEDIKDYWENETSSPPIPHMELMSLNEVASNLKITTEQLVGKLEKQGLSVDSEDQTLKQLSHANGRSPQEIFNILQRGPGPEAENASGSALVLRGLGRRTLEELANEIGVSVSEAVNRLKEREVSVQPDERIRDIAARSQLSPHELVAFITEDSSENLQEH